MCRGNAGYESTFVDVPVNLVKLQKRTLIHDIDNTDYQKTDVVFDIYSATEDWKGERYYSSINTKRKKVDGTARAQKAAVRLVIPLHETPPEWDEVKRIDGIRGGYSWK